VRGYTAVVEYIVVNSTRTTQSYRISFEIRDSDGTRVGDAGQIVQDVAPGEAVRGDRYVGISSARAPSCVVADVS
ncbi:MAG TPA: FxLYD domain-containing protein, partial [Jiangellaceae bacterium]|nr:FxLYD domain-containing protein [Jiangellaceae bacterium]